MGAALPSVPEWMARSGTGFYVDSRPARRMLLGTMGLNDGNRL